MPLLQVILFYRERRGCVLINIWMCAVTTMPLDGAYALYWVQYFLLTLEEEYIRDTEFCLQVYFISLVQGSQMNQHAVACCKIKTIEHDLAPFVIMPTML